MTVEENEKIEVRLVQYMPLAEGEKVVSTIEGDAYNASANIFVRFLSSIFRILLVILGLGRKLIIVATNRRIVTIEVQKIFWFIDGGVVATTHTPRGVNRLSDELERSWLIFKSHFLVMDSNGLVYRIKGKGGKQKVMDNLMAIGSLAEAVNIS